MKTKIKVLFSQAVEKLAGSERYMVFLLPKLKEQGVEAEFVGVVRKEDTQKAEIFLKMLEDEGVRVHRIFISKSYISPKIFLEINKIYKSGNFNCFHSQLIYADFWGSIIKRFLNPKMKIFSTKHGYHIDTYQEFCLKPEQTPKNKYYRIFKIAESNMDKSFACSNGLNEFHEKAGLVKKGQMDVIEHGFNYPPSPSLDDQFKLGEQQLIIVGRLIELKGHDFLLNILPDIRKQYPKIVLVCLGIGPQETHLKNRIKNEGLEKNVLLLGFKKNIMDYMRNSDIVLVPSYTESMPVVILEGFNSKRPVIAFNTIGCRDIIDHNETGILIPAYDEEILKQNILDLLKNPDKANLLAQNAYNKLKSNYSLERMTKETISFYKKYLSSDD